MRAALARRASASLLCGAALAACGGIGSPKAQVVVAIDTDAHVAGELQTRDNVSPDAAMDTLRVDVLDESDSIYDSRTLLVSNASSWPVSFGVIPAASGGGDVRVRIRLFHALLASPDAIDAGATLDPIPEAAIDRLVVISTPAATVQTAVVSLAEDCLGVPATLGAHPSTCVSGSDLVDVPTAGVRLLAGGTIPPSAVGTWAPGVYVPCGGSAGSDQVCIPGGFAILGDPNAGASVPLRPVIVAPFYLDRYEMTVNRLQQLVSAGGFSSPLPSAPSDTAVANASYCTWGVPADADFPVNCVGFGSAAEGCRLAGGTLPTEAQWEYAARGRGERLAYPWGNASPECCSANVGVPEPRVVNPCSGTGALAVGTHPISAACDGTGDVTRDGIADMAANVAEAVADTFASYADPCWTSASILRDPTCASGTMRAVRGTFWNTDPSTAFLALRTAWDGKPTIGVGFRCAYAAKGKSP